MVSAFFIFSLASFKSVPELHQSRIFFPVEGLILNSGLSLNKPVLSLEADAKFLISISKTRVN
jgi:hypothetical protein